MVKGIIVRGERDLVVRVWFGWVGGYVNPSSVSVPPKDWFPRINTE